MPSPFLIGLYQMDHLELVKNGFKGGLFCFATSTIHDLQPGNRGG
jgi:hypothetical protein